MQKIVHLECGHAWEVSKSEARTIKAEGWKSMKCEDCDKHSRILSVRVPKTVEEKVETPRRSNSRNWGQGRNRQRQSR